MRIIDKAIVMHVGWEMDNDAWVVENDDGSRVLRTTSHGDKYVMSINELDEKINETQASLDGLKRLRALVVGEDKEGA